MNRPVRPRAGFTLIELVLVLIIIAAVAALLIPQLANVGRMSDMASSAKAQSDVAANTQLFFLLQKRYPQGLDSLLDTSTTALYSADTTNGDTQTRGFPYGGADGTRLQAQLTPVSIDNSAGDYLRSIQRSGFDWVYDHDTAVVNSNLSNTTFRGIIADANSTGNAAPTTVPVAEVTGTYLLGKLVPGGLKNGQRVIAFGFGQKSTAMGKTAVTCPLYPGADKTYYGRYIVYFMIYASGERASLLGTSDSYGRTSDYTQQQFNEALPDGSRQG